jgi:hypothetical protein
MTYTLKVWMPTNKVFFTRPSEAYFSHIGSQIPPTYSEARLSTGPVLDQQRHTPKLLAERK